jgi:O-succinylbenzoic acid--CoA ligase
MMASGYLNDIDAWNSVTAGGWFTTSDLGEMISGQIRVIGRSDDQIISGGEKISLGTLEKFLGSILSNQEFMACGIPDVEWGTKIVLLSNTTIDVEPLRAKVRVGLGAHAVPKDFLVVDKLPRTSLGKPDRAAAIELYLAAN